MSSRLMTISPMMTIPLSSTRSRTSASESGAGRPYIPLAGVATWVTLRVIFDSVIRLPRDSMSAAVGGRAHVSAYAFEPQQLAVRVDVHAVTG